MTPERYARVHAVFMEACELITAERTPYLDRACAGDPELRAEVESLLENLADDGDIIEDAPPLDDPMRIKGAELDGRYRVDDYAASGGFSHVYQGWHLAWELPVAIKLLKQTLSAQDRADLQASFVREGALQVKLSKRTSAVVQAYDLGTWTSQRGEAVTFTVMEWLEGQALDALITADRSPRTLDAVVALMTPVAEALAIAHGMGIAHRDMKPANIFTLADGGVKLLDFGIAKLAAQYSRGFDSTVMGASPFTAAYAAPEQASPRLGPTGPATDVHGLALVCCELLAGRAPYEASGTTELLQRARDATRRPTPRALGVRVSKPVEKVFAKALAVEPRLRYPDAGAFWAALTQATNRRSGWLFKRR